MKLSSARSLKEELLEEVPAGGGVPRTVVTALRARGSARALAKNLAGTHVGSPSEISVGVTKSPRGGGYGVGVRVHASGARAKKLAAECRRRARGEADVRIVPRVVAAPPTAAEERANARRAAGGAWFQRRRRPLEAGLSVGHVDITAGTLGFIVEDDDAYYVLSNNHVLANVNQASPGDLVVQPGPIDSRVAVRSIVGVLDRYVPISFQRSNIVDCAVASLMAEIEFYVGWTEAIPGVVRGVRAISEDDLGRTVLKVGRTTGVTQGQITQVEIDRLRIDMGDPGAPRIASFSDQFEVVGDDNKPFSLGGDSGSLIVDDAGYAVGLLFAGGPDDNGVDLTFANRIESALDKLGVTLVR